MASPKPSRRYPAVRPKRPSPPQAATPLFHELRFATRTKLEECVVSWTRDLVLARKALQRDTVRGGGDSEARLSESIALLTRLEKDLLGAPDRMEKLLFDHLVGIGENSETWTLDAHRRFERAFGHAPIGMALIDRAGGWLEVNAAFCQITGYSQAELRKTTLESLTHPDEVDSHARQKEDLLGGRIPSYEVEQRYRHSRGDYFWALATVSLVRDERGEPLYWMTQLQEISERKEIARRLAYQVDHDFLTGLSNRRRFEQELAREVRRSLRYRSGGALLLIDLDKFKAVNDGLGHGAGDDLLKKVAAALRRRTRQTDVLARLGGDEFAVLLPQSGAVEARLVAAGIVEGLRQLVVGGNGTSIRITASVGVALFSGLRPEELLARADRALYDAKAAGGERFVMFQGERPLRASPSEDASDRRPTSA